MRTYIITWVLHCDSNKVATANKQLCKASAQVRVSTCNADKLPLMQTQMEEGRSWTACIVKPSSLNLDFSSTNLHLLDTIPSMLLLAMYHLLVLYKGFLMYGDTRGCWQKHKNDRRMGYSSLHCSTDKSTSYHAGGNVMALSAGSRVLNDFRTSSFTQ